MPRLRISPRAQTVRTPAMSAILACRAATPTTGESVLTDSRGAFCARLKAARETKGVTIDQIAASTKIPASLLHGLERCDFSRWPGGLFRRSYLRDYLRMIGLPPDPTVAEFVRLFPDPNEDAAVIERLQESMEHEATPLSLTLADDRSGRASRLRARLVAASLDAAIVAGTSLALVVGLRLDPGLVLAGVAVAYHTAATIALGRTVGLWWTADRHVARWKRSVVRAVPAEDPLPAEDTAPKALPSASTA
jgi:hypothetical protein